MPVNKHKIKAISWQIHTGILLQQLLINIQDNCTVAKMF